VIAQLPVLLGIHATDWLTIVPHVAAGYGTRHVTENLYFPARERTSWRLTSSVA